MFVPSADCISEDFERLADELQSIDGKTSCLLSDSLALAFRVTIVCSFPEKQRRMLYSELERGTTGGKGQQPPMAAVIGDGGGAEQKVDVGLLSPQIEIAQWKVLGLADDPEEVEKVVAMEKSSQ